MYRHVRYAQTMYISMELALRLMHFIAIICLNRLIFFFCVIHYAICVFFIHFLYIFVCVLKQSIVSLHLQYYLNVCRPLVPQYGLSCNANSAACRAILNGTKNPEQEQVNAFESIIRCSHLVYFFFLCRLSLLRRLSVNDIFFSLS